MKEDGKGIALGKHVTLEFYDCDSVTLADAGRMKNAFLLAARESGASVIGADFHSFDPQGVSGFVIIAESHFSVHAWPEYEYAAVDIFTCGDSIDFKKAIDTLHRELKSSEPVHSGVLYRGMVGAKGTERVLSGFGGGELRYALSWQRRFEEEKCHALTLTLDLYEADNVTPEKISGAVAAVCCHTGAECAGECRIGSGKNMTFVQHFDIGVLSGEVLPEEGKVYLDLSLKCFFEPRVAAEVLLALFGGKHYRMQVALRK